MEYSIKIIDLKHCKSTEDIFDNFSNALNFKQVKDKSSEEIKRQILNLNDFNYTNVVIYNIRIIDYINSNYFYDFGSFIFYFNKDNENRIRIDTDYISDLVVKSRVIGDLFYDEPAQYGFRGDIGLWEELKVYFASRDFPENEKVLPSIIADAIVNLTGNSVFSSKHFGVEKYNHGGMSGGAISNRFWTRKAIPILMARMTVINEAYKSKKTFNISNRTLIKLRIRNWFKNII